VKHLVDFRVFESAGSGLTQEQEQFLNKYTEGRWKYNPATGLVDVVGDFDCRSERLKTLSGVKFGKVSGDFDCRDNQLTTLEGAPQEVGGDFYCQRNKLTSLEGAPQSVGGRFHCFSNKLTSLVGAPQEVDGDFDCSGNNLTSLEGAPQSVGGDFYCQRNKLTSLEGAPQEVGRNFYCSGNKLTSLEGAPREVGGYFDCSKNKLSTLEGAPDKIGGDFFCDVFHLGEGGWNPEGWLEILKNGKSEAQSLILTILTPEELNREIQKDPAGMIMKLKPAWNDESFRETRDQLIWPQGYEEEMEIVGGLNTIGF
jgi:hypothetical protein